MPTGRAVARFRSEALGRHRRRPRAGQVGGNPNYEDRRRACGDGQVAPTRARSRGSSRWVEWGRGRKSRKLRLSDGRLHGFGRQTCKSGIRLRVHRADGSKSREAPAVRLLAVDRRGHVPVGDGRRLRCADARIHVVAWSGDAGNAGDVHLDLESARGDRLVSVEHPVRGRPLDRGHLHEDRPGRRKLACDSDRHRSSHLHALRGDPDHSGRQSRKRRMTLPRRSLLHFLRLRYLATR